MTHNIEVPHVQHDEYKLVNIDNGFLNLMSVGSEAKNDIKVPEGDLGSLIKVVFDEGKDILVIVISSMGEEMAVSFKEAPKGN